jgi:hypothetical protein
MYGDVTLQHDLTIPGGYALVIPAFSALTIPNDVTLTNDGVIIVCSGGIINGTIAGTQPIGSDLSISGDTFYTYAEGILTITNNGTYTITMGSGVSSTTNSIVVAPEVTASITLNGVNIDVSGVEYAAAFDMNGATVDLTLIGTNVLKSGMYRAGLLAPEGSALTISAADGTHSLAATGGLHCAGIGGNTNGSGGTITITGGTINAIGGDYDQSIYNPSDRRAGAGIGGGGGGNGGGGTVTITGGTVTATGSYNAAGIGGGGNYNATGGAGGTVTITGGTVTANGGGSGGRGAGIGSGRSGAGGSVTISGGTVTATGGYYDGAGIGGGHSGAGGSVTISGGTVTATGGNYGGAGIGIGGGYDSAAGTIAELSGNAVVFASSIAPTLTAGGNATGGIAFNGNAGTMYGNVTLQQDLTIPNTHTLNLSGHTLTVGSVTLTNNGTINTNNGSIVGTVGGGGTVN